MCKLQTSLLCAYAWSQLETTSQGELFEDVLTSGADFYKLKCNHLSIPLNDADDFGIRISKRLAAKDEGSLALIIALGDSYYVFSWHFVCKVLEIYRS